LDPCGVVARRSCGVGCSARSPEQCHAKMKAQERQPVVTLQQIFTQNLLYNRRGPFK